MFRLNRIILTGLLLLSTSLFGQIPTPIRTVTSLPGSCNGGTAGVATDKVVLVTNNVGVEYTCLAPNTWIPTPGGVNSQTVSYLALNADNGKTIVMNGSSLTLTLPNPPPSNNWKIFVSNLALSSLTVSRNGLNIDGAAANLSIAQNQGTYITTDGTNYFTQRGVGGATTAGVNSQTISYAALSGDNGKLIVMNGSNLTLTLPNPPPTSTWSISIDNINATGLTVSPNSLTIDASAGNLTIGQNQGIYVTTDGVNYFTDRGFYINTAVSGVFATNFGVVANTKYVVDATITNGSNAVTCGVTACNFTSTDNGKICFGTNLPTTGYTAMITSAVVLPQGTLTVTGANTATCSGGNATGNGNRFVWGSDDTTALTNAWNAAKAICQTLQLPSGIMLVQSAIFGASGGQCTIAGGSRRNGLGIVGYEGVTVLVPTPSFNSATCTLGLSGTACIFGVADAVMLKDIIIDGQGNANPGAGFSGKLIADLSGTNSISVHHIYCMGWGAGNTSPITTGYRLASLTGSYDTLWSDGCGQNGVSVTGTVPVWYMDIADNGSANLNINGGVLSCYGCLFTDNAVNNNSCAVNISSGGILNSYGSTYGLSLTATLCGVGVGYSAGSSSAGTFNSYGDTFNFAVSGAFQQIFIGSNSSAVAHLQDLKMISSGGSGTGITISNTGTLYDHGGNNFAGGSTPMNIAAGGRIFGPGHAVVGACTGTATASQSTMGLYGNTSPSSATTTCTVTTAGTGVVMQYPGTLYGLVVNAGTGGVNASSGVFTVLKNGAGTTITCTVGTGTACSDGLHQVTYTTGDLISIQFTTQAAETLANLKASVLY